MCINIMFIDMYGSHWLKKNFLLKEGFDNPVNKICCSSVNSQQHGEIFASWVVGICYMVQSCRQHCNQLCGGTKIPDQYLLLLECNFSSKAEMTGLKEILTGQTYDLKPCTIKSQKGWSCRWAAPLILHPKSDQKGAAYAWVFTVVRCLFFLCVFVEIGNDIGCGKWWPCCGQNYPWWNDWQTR